MLFHEARALVGKDLKGYQILEMVQVGKTVDERHADAYFNDEMVASKYIEDLERLGIRKKDEFCLHYVLVLSDGVRGYVLGRQHPFDIKEALEHEAFTKNN